MLGETFCRKRASLWIFAGVAFLLPGVVWLVQRRMGGVLPESWSHLCMYLPAGGAVLALVYTSHQRKTLPSKFFGFYGIYVASAVCYELGAWLFPQWILRRMAGISTRGDSRRSWAGFGFCRSQRNAGMNGGCHGAPMGALALILLFLGLEFLSILLTAAMQGTLWNGQFLQIYRPFLDAFRTEPFWSIRLLFLPVSFLFTWLLCWGEEYGWRWFLQSRLERKWGLLTGAVLTGALWALWHIPAQLPVDTSMQDVLWFAAIKLAVCVPLGMFLAFACHRTGNIFVVALLHFLHNYLAGFLKPPMTAGLSVGWEALLVYIVSYSVFCLPLLWMVNQKKKLFARAQRQA